MAGLAGVLIVAARCCAVMVQDATTVALTERLANVVAARAVAVALQYTIATIKAGEIRMGRPYPDEPEPCISPLPCRMIPGCGASRAA